MILEFSRKILREEYNGDIKAMQQAEYFSAWTPERIKRAFNFGNGTEADLRRYMENNKRYCIFKEV